MFASPLLPWPWASGACSHPQVSSTDFERLFRSAVEGTVGECARLVAFVAVGVERHAPNLPAAEVAQPTEVEWNLAQPVEVLLACLVENAKKAT
jgi:hypothetical protein